MCPLTIYWTHTTMENNRNTTVTTS